MYQRLGLDYEERVLPSIVNEVLKSVVAKFNASQLIDQLKRKVSKSSWAPQNHASHGIHGCHWSVSQFLPQEHCPH